MSGEFGVKNTCAALGVPTSSYYYWLNKGKAREERTVRLYLDIIGIYSEGKGIYGAPKISAELNKKGTSVSVATVSRAMKTLGIRSIVAAKFTNKRTTLTEQEKQHIVNLIKDIKIVRKNQVWTTDITYIKTVNEGNYYLITFLDSYSRCVVAYDLRKKQTTYDIIEVLKRGISLRKPDPGLIIHSDKGSQFRSAEYRTFLSGNCFIASYTSLDHSCDENAVQESFHSLIKKECIYQTKLYGFDDAFRVISEYIDFFYNVKRSHSSIGYFSPAEFERLS